MQYPQTRVSCTLGKTSLFSCRTTEASIWSDSWPSYYPQSLRQRCFGAFLSDRPPSSSPPALQWAAMRTTLVPTRSPPMRCSTALNFPSPWSTSGPSSLVISFSFINNFLSNVLVCPRREVKRFVDLSPTEVGDLWITAQNVGNKLEHYHKATSLTLNIQDGPEAGQTVPHVHIHILPRKGGDFAKNDEIYDAIDEKEKEQKLDLDKERADRTSEEMAAEAAAYRALFS